MRANINLLWLLTGFFALCTIAYVVWSLLDPAHGRVEWAGTVALGLSVILAAFIAFYLEMVNRGLKKKNAGENLPEDRLDANIDDGDPEIGHFSPWSWWPILLAGGAALLFLGVAVGFWVAFIAVPIVLVALVGWVFEYYRGYFAR